VAERRQALLADDPSNPAERDEAQRARWLAAQLLEYHRREKRPFWWAFFHRLQESSEDLLDDAECVAELAPDPKEGPFADKRSLVYPLRFPPQEVKLSPNTGVTDCASGASAGTVTEIDLRRGVLYLKRGAKLQENALPRAIMPSSTFDPGPQRRGLRRLADTLLAVGPAGEGPHAAAREVLLRRHPTVRHVPRGAPLLEESVAAMMGISTMNAKR